MALSQISVLSALVLSVGTAVGSGIKYYADNTYLRQDAWVQENRKAKQERIQYQIDELEYVKTQRTLTGKEQWQLQRLKSELKK